MKSLICMICIMFLDIVIGLTQTVELSDEDKLIKKLLAKYSRKGTHGRPLKHFNETITVKYNIQLIQIMDLDEKNQVLTLSVWDKYTWEDIYMKWNPEEYGGVQKLRIPSHEIWIPDIKLYNYADDRLSEKREALCIIEYNGTVTWKPQAVYKSSCEIDASTFPFDIQKCTLKFGSWTYHGNLVDLMVLINGTGYKTGSIDMRQYVVSNSWVVLQTAAVRNEICYTCCPDNPFIDISFTIVFQRISTFYNYVLILPCVLLTSLTLVLFWIPPESPAKLMLGINIFVAFFLLLLVMENNLPPAATKVPLLGTYYCLNMILITLSSFLNAFVVNLSFYGARQSLPRYMRMVMFEFFAKILSMESLVSPFQDKTIPEVTSRLAKDRLPILGKPIAEDRSSMWVTSSANRSSGESLFLNHNQLEHDQQQITLQRINCQLGETVDFMKAFRSRVTDRDRKDRVAREWKAVSLIFDRIFFFVYLITIITSLCVILPVITYPEAPAANLAAAECHLN